MMPSAGFRQVTVAEWRAVVEKELAGKSFEKALVHEALEGIGVQPLYVDAPPPHLAARHIRSEPFRICMRQRGDVGELVADVAGGADALWIPLETVRSGALVRADLAGVPFVVEAADVPSASDFTGELLPASSEVMLAADPVGWRTPAVRRSTSWTSGIDKLAPLVAEMRAAGFLRPLVLVSTLPAHEMGADAADELAVALATGVVYVEALVRDGLDAKAAFEAIFLRAAVGRDTFVELAKIRALRVVWAKLAAAFGVVGMRPPVVHAVCSHRTLTVRDPWVNMLRITTQVFAAVVGGADLVTPNAFDEAFGEPSAHGRRVARNTGLVLREESGIGKVNDAAAGSYYFDTLTDALARAAWTRFRRIEKDGGIVVGLESGRLAARFETSWKTRLERIATRKHPVLGVSEFANVDEELPPELRVVSGRPEPSSLFYSREGAAFEALRMDAEPRRPEAVLVTLGALAESRPRVGFATTFFAAGGIRSRETSSSERAPVVCLCGTDESYATEAADRARALKALGVKRVLVAGRPGALEPSLREAGVDGFIFVGCDAVETLGDILASYAPAKANDRSAS